jgi:ribonuclease T2
MNKLHNLLMASGGWLLCGMLQHATAADDVRPQRYTLVIHLAPAVCALDPSKRNLRQCQEGFSLTIASLQPELPAHVSENCNSSSPANLNPIQSRVVERVMPDEQLRREDWQRNGGCTGMNASTYFRTIANYAGRLKVPPEFNSENEVVMQRVSLIRQLQNLNSGLPADGVQLRCAANPQLNNNPVLTELRVCYNPRGQYVSCPAYIKSNCPNTFIVQGVP